jgi:hypothetical protein
MAEAEIEERSWHKSTGYEKPVVWTWDSATIMASMLLD